MSHYVTIGWQIGELLVLASFPLPVTDVKIDLNWAGYSLIAKWWDVHN